ncbi:CoA pyrophosphatase [Vibrio sonorensis]|uniref:CoA pyrophosphatase n=1 Tax=Vibrio sonorensis TaxID=1004316 RepID=UPI0008DA4082|nr:CoA pyrophosphatase [Vibrio sonorensis]
MLWKLDKNKLIQNFQMRQTVDYHRDALKRVDHLPADRLRKASVLVGFVEREEGLHIIFTKRAAHLKHHPGQVSFPGGKFEPLDSDLIHTALRETEEEIGISHNHVKVFGQMPELPTISRFSVTPILAMISPEYSPNIDKNEVEQVFEVPARVVLDPNQLHSATFSVNSNRHRVFAVNYQGHFIWGMTAQIIQAMQRHLR